ncbi:MAG: OmpA family protein [Alphaproteobacteria bacterium]|nr:OmpA family protein [Alphaproteobacteria bacterium]
MKKQRSSMSTLVIAGFLLTGCAVNTAQLPDIAETESSGTAFDTFLRNEYIALSNVEADEFDWRDADTFAARALAAHAGNSPDPEEISARSLPEDRVRLMTGARARLMRAFEAGGREANPAQAAGAQAAFECWMQELEENRQPEDIEACQKDFIFHMEALEAALAGAPPTEPAPAAAPAPDPDLPEPVVIYFGFDSATLSDAAAEKVLEAVKAFVQGGAKTARIVGHTDTSGDPAYNRALAERRVTAVSEEMSINGIAVDSIKTLSMGETQPAVDAGEDAKEFRNRRVVIFFER